MAAYRLVYDSRHLQADCKEPGLAPESYATLGNRVWATFTFFKLGIMHSYSIFFGNRSFLRVFTCKMAARINWLRYGVTVTLCISFGVKL